MPNNESHHVPIHDTGELYRPEPRQGDGVMHAMERVHRSLEVSAGHDCHVDAAGLC